MPDPYATYAMTAAFGEPASDVSAARWSSVAETGDRPFIVGTCESVPTGNQSVNRWSSRQILLRSLRVVVIPSAASAVRASAQRKCHDAFRQLCEGPLDASGPFRCVCVYPRTKLGPSRGMTWWRPRFTVGAAQSSRRSFETYGGRWRGRLAALATGCVSPTRDGIGSVATAAGRGPTWEVLQ
jgi:hypothetical protein